jgi:hypothetical protein
VDELVDVGAVDVDPDEAVADRVVHGALAEVVAAVEDGGGLREDLGHGGGDLILRGPRGGAP